ncbi:FXYD domain-containing ion transport regulator 3-like [Corvus moneduloides]|uniref:FXYD domain-containing ion transport regulator 3-like n=1 Tax=Corvus moneduloides TaxID=1196302 RepID=UPI001362AF29|nr:FXYD domain-containing ion transport regulator 3-like [Corvus moneduloides]
MERESLGALVILGVLSLARGDPPDAPSPFEYDWCQLRVGGLVVAAVLSVVGIIVLLTAAAPPRSCHRWLGQEPPARAELSPGVPRCPQEVTAGGGGGAGFILGAEPPPKMSPNVPKRTMNKKE